MPKPKTRILIVGGGFGGVAAALTFDRARRPDLEITLIANKPHLEYHAALYRVVAGRSPLEVCIPLAEIFRRRRVKTIIDEIIALDPAAQSAAGSSGRRYDYDYAILGLGSETDYFNIPGLAQFSFGFKSIKEALRLRQHLHELFAACASNGTPTEQKICLLHFVVAGGGASGVELAGELAGYLKRLAAHYRLPRHLITLDLFEAAPRLLPALPEAVSTLAARRLRALGVNLFLNRPLVKEAAEQIVVRGLTAKTETVIWTAGIKLNSFYRQIPGLSFDPRGRVKIDEYLRAEGQERIFVIGDGAATPYAGMAQTAIADGRAVAENIIRRAAGQPLVPYRPKKPAYAIPIGRGFALTIFGPLTIAGRPGWWLRRLADLRYFLSILPPGKALTVFRHGQKIADHCPICNAGNHDQKPSLDRGKKIV